MSIGRFLKRGKVFASKLFRPWTLAGARSATALAKRLNVEGTSAERLIVCGTSAYRIVPEGTSAERKTLESVS